MKLGNAFQWRGKAKFVRPLILPQHNGYFEKDQWYTRPAPINKLF
jgi:hypothetical protein